MSNEANNVSVPAFPFFIAAVVMAVCVAIALSIPAGGWLVAVVVAIGGGGAVVATGLGLKYRRPNPKVMLKPRIGRGVFLLVLGLGALLTGAVLFGNAMRNAFATPEASDIAVTVAFFLLPLSMVLTPLAIWEFIRGKVMRRIAVFPSVLEEVASDTAPISGEVAMTATPPPPPSRQAAAATAKQQLETWQNSYILGSVDVNEKGVVTHRDSYLFPLSVASVRRPFLGPAIIFGGAALLSIFAFGDLLYFSEILTLLIVGGGLLFAGWQIGQLSLLSLTLRGSELSGAVYGAYPALNAVRTEIGRRMEEYDERERRKE